MKNDIPMYSFLFLFFFLMIYIFAICTDNMSDNHKNKSKHQSYSSYSSNNSYDPVSSAANILYTIDNYKYSKSSYEYCINNIKNHCTSSEASIADIVYVTQQQIYKLHGVKPSMLEIARGLSIAVDNDYGQKHDLKQIAAAFAVIY